MMAILAVRETVARLEASLPDSPANEREALIALLVSYDEAADALAHAYVAERAVCGRDLPTYEGLFRD